MFVALPLHVLSAIVWIGGMIFAHTCLRPSAAQLLDPATRLPLWSATLKRFFLWVWHAMVILIITGYWMVFSYFGGFAKIGIHVHVMQGLGLIMVAIFLFVFFVPFKRLKQNVAASQWEQGAAALATIRKAVGINIILGVLLVVVAVGGQFFS